MFERLNKKLIKILLSASFFLVAGCATTQQMGRVAQIDPFESVNRAVFSFNESADEYVVSPVAEVYKFILPDFVRTSVTNFLGNIGDIFVAANNILQGKPQNAANDIGRILINSTIGVLGLFDVATDAGLEKNKEDFGQTLGVWGVSSGPYVVLPLFGPSSVRDSVGFLVDVKADFISNGGLLNQDQKVSLITLKVVNQRANLAYANRLIEDAAFDKYSFMRDSYFQRRLSLIYDGNPPLQSD